MAGAQKSPSCLADTRRLCEVKPAPPEAVSRQILDCSGILKIFADLEAEPSFPDKRNVEHSIELLPGSVS